MHEESSHLRRLPSLTIFVQNKIGGVQFYFANLRKAGAFADFAVRFVATDCVEEEDTKLNSGAGIADKIVSYSRVDNCYSTYRRLAAEIPKSSGVVFTNFAMELQCLDTYRRSDVTVFHFCHDEEYVDLALEYRHVIDVFVAHNPHFADRLRAELPECRKSDVVFLPFGIHQDLRFARVPNRSRPLQLVFIGRLHRRKGVLNLPIIAEVLRSTNIEVSWTILGSGPETAALSRAMLECADTEIESPADLGAMLRKAAEGDVFLLPTELDGTPLALMEAMSVGLVPIVSEFNPGARWMVPPATGFIASREVCKSFAGFITQLHRNREELETRSGSSLSYARTNFDIRTSAPGYKKFLSRWQSLRKHKTALHRSYGGRLDLPWLPNALVACLRRSLK